MLSKTWMIIREAYLQSDSSEPSVQSVTLSHVLSAGIHWCEGGGGRRRRWSYLQLDSSEPSVQSVTRSHVLSAGIH